MALDDEQLAVELDSRDQLARFRSQFHLPTVGELTGRAETSVCGYLCAHIQCTCMCIQRMYIK